MEKIDVVVVGAGPAGLEASRRIVEEGFNVLLIEQEQSVGGKLKQWDKLFPNFTSAQELLSDLEKGIDHNRIMLRTNTVVQKITSTKDRNWLIKSSDGQEITARALLLTTGFDFFDARRKEEYGYGLYPNVITSVDLEKMLLKNQILFHLDVKNYKPKIAFIQCVGSRDEKMGNHFCSKNCCICAVKQAIEVKELLPDAEITCFYMDLRMFGQNYEELYRKSQQEFGINFIRGRVSEISPTFDERVVLKAEDTLLGRPLKATFDLVVLMVGMEPCESTKELTKDLNIQDDYGFLKTKNDYTSDHHTNCEGLFAAGSNKRQMNISEVLKDADAASYSIAEYLRKEIE